MRWGFTNDVIPFTSRAFRLILKNAFKFYLRVIYCLYQLWVLARKSNLIILILWKITTGKIHNFQHFLKFFCNYFVGEKFSDTKFLFNYNFFLLFFRNLSQFLALFESKARKFEHKRRGKNTHLDQIGSWTLISMMFEVQIL